MARRAFGHAEEPVLVHSRSLLTTKGSTTRHHAQPSLLGCCVGLHARRQLGSTDIGEAVRVRPSQTYLQQAGKLRRTISPHPGVNKLLEIPCWG